MSVLWTVVLLNSLLIPSQGFIIPLSVARPDTNGFKDSPAKDVPQRASGGLLGGNLLGSLLGKKGLVGGLLGENGPVGNLLGEKGLVGGLLGENGPVGNLLGEKGLVGGLLGENGPVGNLLGEKGLVGGLLGENGPVGNLLGEKGLVGGLLGENGPVGNLLGEKGLVGGLLGENGPVGSLLGEKGLVGGLLGGDGLLGGLLGQNGAVGGLLGGNGLLGGESLLGGLLGQDGVVSGLLGQDGILGGILGKGGLRIVNNTLPKISLRSLPGFGHQVDFQTQLLVESSVPGQPLCQLVEVDATILVRDTWMAPQNALNCKIVDINTRVRPRVPVLEEPLKRLLSNTLKDLGCNIINAKLKVLSSLLGSRNQVLPLGALGDLPSFSILSGDAIQIDLNFGN
ncbi:uncharacterized protein LOC143695428 [Agelaius phoeniceus]|uniref:uncharacterized protein LOC143695428 n=1 Tax=Agelaius phoeniceus TaxID=39638 RepID=UPI0040550E1C